MLNNIRYFLKLDASCKHFLNKKRLKEFSPWARALGVMNTGWPIKIKPHRNLYTKGCVKMGVSQQ